jgi:hypothetical protein
MRIKIVRTPVGDVDGIELSQYKLGRQYDLGTMLATLFLAEGWAEPVDDEPHTAFHVPFNFTRQTYSSSIQALDRAADFERRRKRRRSSD